MKSKQGIRLSFEYGNEHYEGEAIPSLPKQEKSSFPAFDIFFNDEFTGKIVRVSDEWTTDNHFDKGLIAAIGGILITLFITM